MLLSPTSDTKNLVIQTYDGHPIYSCAKCAAVIVRILQIREGTRDSSGLTVSSRRID